MGRLRPAGWVLIGIFALVMVIGLIQTSGVENGGSSGGSEPARTIQSPAATPAEEPSDSDQADREFDICMKQAEDIAAAQGSKAGNEHLDQCVEIYRNTKPAEP